MGWDGRCTCTAVRYCTVPPNVYMCVHFLLFLLWLEYLGRLREGGKEERRWWFNADMCNVPPRVCVFIWSFFDVCVVPSHMFVGVVGGLL